MNKKVFMNEKNLTEEQKASNTYKNIQADLIKITEGMGIDWIYSEVTYFLVGVATHKENHYTDAYNLSTIFRLLIDSYLLKITLREISPLKGE